MKDLSYERLSLILSINNSTVPTTELTSGIFQSIATNSYSSRISVILLNCSFSAGSYYHTYYLFITPSFILYPKKSPNQNSFLPCVFPSIREHILLVMRPVDDILWNDLSSLRRQPIDMLLTERGPRPFLFYQKNPTPGRCSEMSGVS